MSIYTKKLIGYFSNPEHRLRRRSELSDFALDEEEYFNNFLKYEVSFLNKLKISDFHTSDYPDTGSFDFHFGIHSVQVVRNGFYEDSVHDETVRLYVDISPGGTVDMYREEDDEVVSHYITDSLISNHKDGWEINNEILDIIRDVILLELPKFVDNTRLFDIIELYINYPLD
jgi:hypothetical protein